VAHYPKLKKTCEALVIRWEWATNQIHEVKPFQFERYHPPRGRKLAKPPAEIKARMHQYGIDDKGRTTVIRKYTEFSGLFLEQFFVHATDVIDGTLYDHHRSKGVINVTRQRFKDGRIVFHEAVASGGSGLEEYLYEGDRIACIEITGVSGGKAYHHTDALTYDMDGLLILVHRVYHPSPHGPKGGEEVVFRRAPAKKAKRHGKQKLSKTRAEAGVTLDLSKDAVVLRKTLKHALSKYTALNKTAASYPSHPPLTRVDLTFDLSDGGDVLPYVWLELDTRPGADPDGTHTHERFAALDRPLWREAFRAYCDETQVTLRLPDGSTCVCRQADADKGDPLTEGIGEFLVELLKSMRADGSLRHPGGKRKPSLPTGSRCELGVEAPSGDFGWPNYADRGKDNLL
jgi:hypothetical protein